MQGLAFTRFRLGRYDEAEAILREVIPLAPEARAEDLNTRGAVQGSRLYLSQWLALALVQQQRFDEAESILEGIVAEAESLAGGDSLFLLHTLPSLSRVFDGQARYAEALRIDERVLRATGTPYAMQDLAIAYARFGRYEESEPLFRGALKGYSDSKGPDHPLTLHVRDNIASLLASTGRQDEAVAMRRELFAARRRVLGEWHEATLDSQESLAVLLAETGQLPEAMALARDAVAGRRFANGPRDLATGGGLAALGRVLLSAGDRDGAAEQLREALEIYRDVLGGDHPSAARLLATYLAVLGDLTGSLEALRSAAVRGLSDARSLEQDPVLAPLLELPGMQRLLEDLRSRADATRRTLSSELGVR